MRGTLSLSSWALKTSLVVLATLALVLASADLLARLGSPEGGGASALGWWARAGRTSVLAAACASVLGVTGGSILAAAALFGPRFVGGLLTRFAELSGTLPAVITLALSYALFGARIEVFVAVVTILRAAEAACVVRGRVAQVLAADFVAAARALGAPPRRLLLRHVAPHVLFTAVTSGVLGTASGVGLEAAAGLIGLAPGAAPSWGEALARGISNGQWGVATASAAGILVTLTALWVAAHVLERSARVVPRSL